MTLAFPVRVFLPAVCSGEITDSAGVVLSPNWPEAYDKGQDCIWGIHVEEDKRIMLDIQVYVRRWKASIQSPDAPRYIHPPIHPFVLNHCSSFRGVRELLSAVCGWQPWRLWRSHHGQVIILSHRKIQSGTIHSETLSSFQLASTFQHCITFCFSHIYLIMTIFSCRTKSETLNELPCGCHTEVIPRTVCFGRP